MQKRKLAPLPNIDLGARYRIIDDTGDVPVWKTIARGVCDRSRAKRLARKYNEPGVWIHDDLGYKEYVRA